MTPSAPDRRWALLGACAAAGALAVPLGAVGTPVAVALAALAGLLGLRVWRWSRLPVLLSSEELRGPRRFVSPVLWLGLGLAVGLLLLGVLRTALEPALPSIGVRLAKAGSVPLWRRAAIIYVAAVGEELVFRLILLSMAAGVAVRLLRPPRERPPAAVVWFAIAFAAIAFGAAHLPAWSAAAPLPAALAVSVVTLNTVGGIVFGRVFATRGIGPAMWTHAGADCAIQLLGPLTG